MNRSARNVGFSMTVAVAAACSGGTDASPAPPLRFLAPDTLELGEPSADGTTSFDVPANTVGFTLTVRASSGAVRIVDLVGPTGAAVRQGQRVLPSTATRSDPGSTATASVPAGGETRNGPVPAGRWTAKITAPAGARVFVRIQRTADGLVHGGVVDLHVHVPRGLSIDTPGPAHTVVDDDLAGDLAIAARVDAFFDRLHAAFGLDRGDVTFVSTEPSWATFTTADFVTKLPRMCVGVGDAPGFHVLLTQHHPALIPSGGTVNVPAAQTVGDCTTSVTFLALMARSEAAQRGIPDIVAFESNTLLHEFGHAAGLFHTTETSGVEFDPILDTPECLGATSETAASCPDVDDVMFPSQVLGPRSTVTELQRRVVFGASVVRPYARTLP